MTDRSELDELLRKAATYKMTPDERFEQRVSFVYGQLMDCQPDITKDEVRQRLREHMGEATKGETG